MFSDFLFQVTQLANMLNALLVKDIAEFEHLHGLFLQCLYWSLGAALLEDGRIKFDNYIKYICGLTQVDGKRAGPGMEVYRSFIQILCSSY